MAVLERYEQALTTNLDSLSIGPKVTLLARLKPLLAGLVDEAKRELLDELRKLMTEEEHVVIYKKKILFFTFTYTVGDLRDSLNMFLKTKGIQL